MEPTPKFFFRAIYSIVRIIIKLFIFWKYLPILIKFRKKSGYHYYAGNDLYFFRYPDEEMLKTGNIFSQREFEIIKLVGEGLSTEQIAQKLFLSPFTVNTHRANILKKSDKAHISYLLVEFHELGLL